LSFPPLGVLRRGIAATDPRTISVVGKRTSRRWDSPLIWAIKVLTPSLPIWSIG
jgi:hypothetical protein